MKPSVLDILLVAIIAVLLLTHLGAAQPSGVHEYKIIFEAQTGPETEKALNALGRNGWSLVAVTAIPYSTAANFYFQK